jgi:hypothetical protein
MPPIFVQRPAIDERQNEDSYDGCHEHQFVRRKTEHEV